MPRPSSREAPESQDLPTVAQLGALSVVLYAAVNAVAVELTVRAMVVVCVSEPEVPVTVTVAVPSVAVLLAVRVSVLVPVVLAGLNDAVTPVGNPEAARLTLLANPFVGLTVIVHVPFEPCLIPLAAMEGGSGAFGSVRQ